MIGGCILILPDLKRLGASGEGDLDWDQRDLFVMLLSILEQLSLVDIVRGTGY